MYLNQFIVKKYKVKGITILFVYTNRKSDIIFAKNKLKYLSSKIKVATSKDVLSREEELYKSILKSLQIKSDHNSALEI